MEALAAGVPLVVTNLPVFREIFTGVARFADNPAELAAQLCTGLTEQDAGTRKAGRALATRHTWSAAAQRHLTLYHHLALRRCDAP